MLGTMTPPHTGRAAGRLVRTTPTGKPVVTTLGTGAFARTGDHLPSAPAGATAEPALVLRVAHPLPADASRESACRAVEKIHLGVVVYAAAPRVVLGSDIHLDPAALDEVTAAVLIDDHLHSATGDGDLFDDPVDLLGATGPWEAGHFLVTTGLCRPAPLPPSGCRVTADFYDFGRVRVTLG